MLFPSRLTSYGIPPLSAQAETRRISAAVFGNEKMVEVLLALGQEQAATAQVIAAKTGISHSLVRDVLLRLVAGGAVRALPKIGGSRSPQFYEPIEGPLWDALMTAARAVVQAPSRPEPGPP